MLEFEYSTGRYSSQDALAFAKACQLAYSIKKNDGNIESQLKNSGFSDYLILNKQLGERGLGKHVDTQAFVAVDDLNIIIAFCGSESLPDWLTNFDCVTDPGPFPESSVHEGFQDALFPVLLQLVSRIRTFDPQGVKNLWITGHSLGGAHAVLLAAMFSVEEMPVRGVYTYGAPRLGNSSFAKIYDEHLGNITYRIVNEGDLVPHLPPEFLGFLHCGKAILFQSDGSRMDDDTTTWKKFRESIGAWMSHVGKQDIAIRDYHLLLSPNGYLQKLQRDLHGRSS